MFDFNFADPKVVIGLVAGILSFLSYVIYFVSILMKKTKPNRATWSIWAFMGFVLALSYQFSGATDTIWVPYAEFLGAFIVAILSIKYGEGGLKDKTDLVCLAGAILSIILWIIFNNPVIALVTNLLVDSFAVIPTIKKTYLRPEGEDFWAWFSAVLADSLNMFAIGKISFSILVLPLYILLTDATITFLIILRGKNFFIKKI